MQRSPVSPSVAVVFALTLGVACSSSSSSTSSGSDTGAGSDGGGDGATFPLPVRHRPSAAGCPTDRPAGFPPSSPHPGDTCAKDADCTAGKNGRCVGGLSPYTCSYDLCVVDGDCGSGSLCDCRNGAIAQGANTCLHGNCRTDADCAGRGCSPSATDVDPGCLGIPTGSLGYFCHVAGDECLDDKDCTKTFDGRCLFDADVRHFRCAYLMCPG